MSTVTLLRSTLFNLCFYSWLLLLAIPSFPLLLLPRRLLPPVVRFWAGGVMVMLRLICGLRYRVEGLEHLPAGPVLVAAKHQSAWDTMIFLLLFRDPAYVLKQELFKLPVYGWFARHHRMIGIDRAGRAAALKAMLTAAQEATAEGRSLVIFPQGTRTTPGQPATEMPYHSGVYALARGCGLPTLPVALNSGQFWGSKAYLKRPGEIIVRFLPALPPDLDRKTYMTRLEQEIETATTALESRR